MDSKTYSDYMILIMKLNAENHSDDILQFEIFVPLQKQTNIDSTIQVHNLYGPYISSML